MIYDLQFAIFNNINELPKDWQVAKLGEIAEITMEQSPQVAGITKKEKGYLFYKGKKNLGIFIRKQIDLQVHQLNLAKKAQF